MSERQRLDENITNGRGLDRTGHDRKARRVGCKLVEQLAATSAAHDVQFFEFAGREIFQLP